MTDVHDVDGVPAAIRAAIIATGGVGNVFLKGQAQPFPWNGETVPVPDGINIFGASYAGCSSHPNWTTYPASTILHNNVRGRTMFTLNNTVNSRVSGIQFEALPPTTPDSGETGTAIMLTQCKNYRVDHCTFINFAENSVVPELNWEEGTSSYGLLDHCYVYEPYKLDGRNWLWAYGFYSIGAMDYNKGPWDTDLVGHFLGKYQAVPNCSMMFVEDSHFSYSRHCTDAIQGAWNVIRYNLCDHNYPEYGSIDSHGTVDDGRYWGARGTEVYGNRVLGVAGENGNNAGVRLRGGSGFIYNNEVIGSDPASYGVQLDDYDVSTLDPITNIHDTYVWNNIATNCIPLSTRQGVRNRDYWEGTLTKNPDGSWTLPALTGKSAITYIPYVYPHPLTWGDEPVFDLSVKANVKAGFQLDKIL